MTKRKDLRLIVGDIETPHPTVADSFGDESGGRPQTVRLGDLWSRFSARHDPGAGPESAEGSQLSPAPSGRHEGDPSMGLA
jgi:hypothetical protein